MELDADKIAYDIGDTFINCWEMSPVQQWGRIITLLEEYGYKIIKKDSPAKEIERFS
jgi:hypothetical protein